MTTTTTSSPLAALSALSALPALAALLLTAGCGGATTAAPIAEPEQPLVWDDMNPDQRRAFMADEVVPRMAPLFGLHDPERFASFGCADCHGETGPERGYAMPNPDLFTLYATGSQEQADMVTNQRPMVNFMFQEVVPAMKELLGAPDYDAETGEGFSCYYCHPNGGAGTPVAAPEAADSRFMPRGNL